MHWQALLNCFLCICTLPVLETFYAWSCDKITKKTRFKIQCVWNIPKFYFKFPKLCILQSELLNKYLLLNIHWILSQYVILNFKWQQRDWIHSETRTWHDNNIQAILNIITTKHVFMERCYNQSNYILVK